jgi:hypothetical protein
MKLGSNPGPVNRACKKRLTKAFTRPKSLSSLRDLNNRFKYIACFEDVASRGSNNEAYNVRK